MSSVKKSKLDLLFKVRYQNPLPAPPFPPKLLNIPTNPSRYAEPEFITSLATETPLPMVIDGELGMPLDLSQYDCLWDDNADDSQLNPDPISAPSIDPKDAFMLSDFPLSTTNGSYLPSPAPTPQVSWLRKTEYISSSAGKPTAQSHSNETRRANEDAVAVDVSLPAQIKDIEQTFKYAGDDFDLTKLKHPSKPGVTAVDSYEIFPDAEIWANAYDLFRFSERPGDRPVDQPDPRLATAMLRPMESDGDHFLAYYLPKDDADAEAFVTKRRTGQNVEGETIFTFVRDYETVKIEQDISNEFVFVLDEGEGSDGPQKKREKAAYYKSIERKIVLKKKRANPWDTYADKWDAINLTLVPFSDEEAAEREEAVAEVTDPHWSRAAEADADGEVDDETQQTIAGISIDP